MNILFLMRYWPYYGGGETVTRTLAKEFVKNGIEVHILYFWEKNEKLYNTDYNIKLKCLNVGEPDTNNNFNEKYYTYLSKELTLYCTENNIDIIINQWWPIDNDLFKVNIGKTKIITCRHSFVIPPHLSGYSIKNKIKLILKSKSISRILEKSLDKFYLKSDLLIFLSQKYKQEYIKNSTSYTHKKPVEVCYNPLSDICQEYTYVQENKFKEIIFVGRIQEDIKRIKRIINAWDIISKDSKFTDWTLKIIGDGPDLPSLKEYVENKQIKSIFFLGAKNPIEEYKRASIFVLTSDYEGWPMVILEAQHYGVVPIVLNSFSAATEIIKNKENGIIVTSRKKSCLVKAIKGIMIDKDLRNNIAQNGIINSNQFTPSNVVKHWIEILKNVKQIN